VKLWTDYIVVFHIWSFFALCRVN